ncbi:FGF signaling regulator protein canopy b [Oratosquilla oratoria]|uniref:FGF signaling regulator protein canopy b n=1 Tax=Oratosquilla oratoria TaxID=337810 RepID=UPI003F76FA92
MSLIQTHSKAELFIKNSNSYRRDNVYINSTNGRNFKHCGTEHLINSIRFWLYLVIRNLILYHTSCILVMKLPPQILLLFLCVCKCFGSNNIEEEKYGVKFASDCEVCKLVTKELAEKLNERDSSDVIETGYNIDGQKKKTKYNKSELRLVEAMEVVCQGMLDYRIHKERTDSTRWAKMMSQTFKTLHGLVSKGVKVELGIPYELWDKPSAEVTHIKVQCETFVEDNEEMINDWYFGNQEQSLQKSVCPAVLKDAKCLQEPYGEDIKDSPDTQEDTQEKTKKKKKKIKGDTGRAGNEL